MVFTFSWIKLCHSLGRNKLAVRCSAAGWLLRKGSLRISQRTCIWDCSWYSLYWDSPKHVFPGCVFFLSARFQTRHCAIARDKHHPWSGRGNKNVCTVIRTYIQRHRERDSLNRSFILCLFKNPYKIQIQNQNCNGEEHISHLMLQGIS